MGLEGNWARYDARPQARVFERIYVTINYKGQIHLSRNAYQQLGHPGAVTLYYERDMDKIAIEAADVRAKGSVRVVPKQFGACYISARPFCKKYHIDVVGTLAFREPDIDHSGILVLDLNNTERAGGWVSKATAEKYRERLGTLSGGSST